MISSGIHPHVKRIQPITMPNTALTQRLLTPRNYTFGFSCPQSTYSHKQIEQTAIFLLNYATSTFWNKGFTSILFVMRRWATYHWFNGILCTRALDLGQEIFSNLITKIMNRKLAKLHANVHFTN